MPTLEEEGEAKKPAHFPGREGSKKCLLWRQRVKQKSQPHRRSLTTRAIHFRCLILSVRL